MLHTLSRRLAGFGARCPHCHSHYQLQAHKQPARTRALCTTSPSFAPPIKLRDYQEECIQSVLASLDKGHKRLGISLATGGGKTVIFTQLISRITPPSPTATQTLVLAHRRELVEQAAHHCTTAYPDKVVDIEMGNLHATGHADITVASIQSITSPARLAKFDPTRFKLVLVDEAHHIVAPGYLRVLNHFGLDTKRASSPALIGVSATLSRFDGLRLGAAIDEIVYHRDYVDMIAEKWLSDVAFTTVESKADVSAVRCAGSGGDFRPAELSRAVNTDHVNEITVRSWLAHAAADRRSTLVFCVDLAHVDSLTRKFRQHGIDARSITGDTPNLERSRRLDEFRRGEFPVLVNCGVFTEGTDIPGVDCVVLARPTKSRNLLVQMIGRGMRLAPGKKNCHVIDMVSSLETGIVTTPTLFGLDPGEIVQNVTPSELRDRLERKQQQRQLSPSDAASTGIGEEDERQPLDPNTRVTFTQYSSVLDLISDTSSEKHIRALSQNAWVHVGGQKYVLTSPGGTYLRVEPPATPSSSLHRAVEVRALPPGVAKSPFAAPRELLTATSLADAVHGCDAYAAANFPHVFINRFQRWRKGPPTKGQLDFLNKLRGKGAEPLAEGDVTKGEAMDMITKVRHGARGQFTSLEVERRKRDRENRKGEAARERRRNEMVSVGPVR
ncbi:related to 51.5 kDa protein [Cephalotrichum gorgonifer]|uniref:Related to 51.5 kDa protein n=1 Tax=Cephalotrichum gorgonifer TaxID=2041049 RepID=A0AAE8N4N7_9PEZI|nr:related to 51.5 kDa protein [Cephalotrichum gorgonifer]